MESDDAPKFHSEDKLPLSAWAAYQRDLDSNPSLTVEREWELADMAAEGDREALHELVCGNLRYAYSIARRYAYFGADLEDLVQEGNIALIKAAEQFAAYDQPQRIYFKHYARDWIRAFVVQAVDHNAYGARMPRKRTREIGQIGKARRRLRQRLEREPTLSELALATDLDLAEVELLLAWDLPPLPLAGPPPPGPKAALGGLLHERLSDLADEVSFETAASENREEVEWLLRRMRPRNAMVLRYYYGIGDVTREHTHLEISQLLGVSRERARQIHKEAIAEARRVIERANALEERWANAAARRAEPGLNTN